MADPPPYVPFRRIASVRDNNGRFEDRFPEWTNPTHPSATDGNYYYPSFRPAMLPADRARNPTREALRFGINPLADIPAGRPGSPVPGRSMLTPIDKHPDPAFRDEDMDGRDEEYQGMLFGEFTTAQLMEEGVYIPDDDLAGRLDLCDLQDAPLSPLVARDRWKNLPVGNDAANPALFYGLAEDFEFNMNHPVSGTLLWEVLRPVLVIVSKVIEVHPYWAAILSPCACSSVDPGLWSRFRH